MELKQLGYFVAVAQEGTISGAARRLNLTQPPLSAQMKLLEQEVGCPLFERGSRKIQLTEAGRMLYSRAATMLELADITRQELKDYLEGTSGVLRLGVVSSVGSTYLSRIVSGFHAEHPQIAFELMEANTYQLLEQLKSNLLELAIVRTPFADQGFTSFCILEEPMLAVGHQRFFDGPASQETLSGTQQMPTSKAPSGTPQMPLSKSPSGTLQMPTSKALSGAPQMPPSKTPSGAPQMPTSKAPSGTPQMPLSKALSGAPSDSSLITGSAWNYPLLPLSSLADKPLIIYRRWEEVLAKRFKSAHIDPAVFCKNDDARTSALWADAGLGVAILPASAAGLIRDPQTCIYQIDDRRLCSGICVVTNRDAWLSAIARTFLSYLKQPLPIHR